MRRMLTAFVLVVTLFLLGCGQPTQGISQTSVEPTQTLVPPTATPVPPTATSVPPTATATLPPPPTATLPPTATATPRIPTATATATPRTPTPTTPAQPPRPLGAAPQGWKTYLGNKQAPFAIYYPPTWQVDESNLSNGYVVFNDPSVYRAVLVGTTGARTNLTADQLRDQYFNEVLQSCVNKGIDITRDNAVSGLTFKSVGATCNQANDTRLFYSYIGLGLNNNVPWRFRFYSIYGDYGKNAEDYFVPMISSLNIYANP